MLIMYYVDYVDVVYQFEYHSFKADSYKALMVACVYDVVIVEFHY